MKNNLVISLLLIFCLPTLVLAQDEASNTEKASPENLEFDAYTVAYDEVVELNDQLTSYYLEDAPVLSTFDSNTDGNPDIWLRYGSNGEPDLEAKDTDFDGEIDTVNQLENDEVGMSIKAPEFKLKDISLPPNPNPATNESAETKQDAVPDSFQLDPPPMKNRFSIPWDWLIAAILLVAGWLAYKKGILKKDHIDKTLGKIHSLTNKKDQDIK